MRDLPHLVEALKTSRQAAANRRSEAAAGFLVTPEACRMLSRISRPAQIGGAARHLESVAHAGCPLWFTWAMHSVRLEVNKRRTGLQAMLSGSRIDAIAALSSGRRS